MKTRETCLLLYLLLSFFAAGAIPKDELIHRLQSRQICWHQPVVLSSPDFIITYNGNLSITNVSGISGQINLSRSGDNMRITVTGTHSFNGGPLRNAPEDIPIDGIDAITINGGSGDESVILNSLGNYNIGTLTINGGGGNDGIRLNSIYYLKEDSNVIIDARGGTESSFGTLSGGFVVSGTGQIKIRVSGYIFAEFSSTIFETENGDITLEAFEQEDKSINNQGITGVRVSGLIKVKNIGNISIKGRPTNSGSSAVDVRRIEGNISNIFIEGFPSLNNNTGTVFVSNFGIITSSGNIEISGIDSGIDSGINISANVLALNSGNISFLGTASINANPQPRVETANGDISIISTAVFGAAINIGNAFIKVNGSGNITLDATSGLLGGVNTSSAIRISNGGAKLESVDGDITILGRGRICSATEPVINGSLSSVPWVIEAIGNGNIIIHAIGPNDENCGSVPGININGSVLSKGGDINITSEHFGAVGFSNFATAINNIKTEGSGSIIISATGGDYISEGGGGGNTTALRLGGNISTENGSINILGFAANNQKNERGVGIEVRNTCKIFSENNGSIKIHGKGGNTLTNSNLGIQFWRNSTVECEGCEIEIIGEEGSGLNSFGVTTATLSLASDPSYINIKGEGGKLKLIANSLSISSGSSKTINTNTSAQVEIMPFTPGVGMILGTSADPIGGPVGLTQSELNEILTPLLILGDEQTGEVAVQTAVTRNPGCNVIFNSGDRLKINASSFNSGGGEIRVAAEEGLEANATGVDFRGSLLVLESNNPLRININGPTVDVNFTQLRVDGNVQLNNPPLILSGNHNASPGQSFMILRNDGTNPINGQFLDLPEGAVIPNFLQTAFSARISYKGGDGNDVVLSVFCTPEAVCIPQDGNTPLVLLLDDVGELVLSAADLDGGSFDPCGGPLTLSISSDGGSTFSEVLLFDCDVYDPMFSLDNQVILRVTDQNGNSGTCSVWISVEDRMDPVADCIEYLEVYINEDGSDTEVGISLIQQNSTDNCSIVLAEISRDLNSWDQHFFVSCEDAAQAFSTSLIAYLRVFDAAGNMNSCQTEIIVADFTIPTAVCQDITVALDAEGEVLISFQQLDGGSSDNCIVIDVTFFEPPFTKFIDTLLDCSKLGTNDFILRVTDIWGNDATCVATVTVQDTTPPSFTCPGNVTLASCDDIIPDLLSNVQDFADNCGLQTMEQFPLPGAPATPSNGTFLVTISATDVNGNSSNCQVTLSFQEDSEVFFTNCPQDETIEIALIPNECEAELLWEVPQAQAGCSEVEVLQIGGPILGEFGPAGVYLIEYVAEDAEGNTASCSFFINVIDTENPFIACPEDLTVGTNSELCFWESPPGSLSPLEAVANCPFGVSWTLFKPSGMQSAGFDDVSGEVFDLGQSQIRYLVQEFASGQSWECIFNVTVVDAEAPVFDFSLCDQIFHFATSPDLCFYPYELDLSGIVYDNCNFQQELWFETEVQYPDQSTDQFFGPNLELNAPVGETLVLLTATDEAGNSSSCQFTIIVADEAAPQLFCPIGDLFFLADGESCTYTVESTELDPFASDNCDVPQLVYLLQDMNFDLVAQGENISGTVLNPGQYRLIWTATDVSGNSSTCELSFEVLSESTPNALCIWDIEVELGEDGLAQLGAIELDGGSFSTCGGELSYEISRSPDSGFSPSLLLDCDDAQAYIFNFQELIAYLRVTDASGSSSICSSFIIVADFTIPTAVCQDITVALDAAGEASIIPADADGGSEDNCGIVSIRFQVGPLPSDLADLIDYSCADIGSNTVLLRVADIWGNTATCVATVTVQDTAAPALICIGQDTLQAGLNGLAILPDYLASAQFSDNCEVLTTSQTPAAGEFVSGGQDVVLTISIADASGNLSECTILVHVLEAITEAICPDSLNACSEEDPFLLSVALPLGGVYEGIGVSNNIFDPSVSGEGEFTISYTISDGITSFSCAFVISVSEANCCPEGSEFPIAVWWYEDADEDGFGNPAMGVRSCDSIPGFVRNNLDCDDSDSDVNPLAEEACNGKDNNCNGVIDEGCEKITVRGLNNLEIINGSETLNVLDGTMMGSTNIGGVVSRVYTIHSDGVYDLFLNGSPVVQLSGADAHLFEIVQMPISGTAVAPGNFVPFEVRFSGAPSFGTYRATVVIPSNDFFNDPYEFDFAAVASPGRIVLRGNSVNIPNASLTTSLNNHTDFGVVNFNTSRTRTFTIFNIGTQTLNLTGTPVVNISGPNADMFTVTLQPANTVPSGGNRQFQVRFDALQVGQFEAFIEIASDDAGNNPFIYKISATVNGPNMQVRFNSNSGPIIEHLDFNPTTLKGTDFGIRAVGSTRTHAFYIRNLNGGILSLNGTPRVQISGSGASMFNVVTVPVANIAAGSSSLLRIAYQPTSTGTHLATVTIPNNQPDKDPYTFTITGSTPNAFSFDPLWSAANSLQEDTELAVFPTPCSDVLYVNMVEDVEHLDFQVLDLNGRAMSASMVQSGRQLRLDVSALPAGVYWIRSSLGFAKFVKM